MSGSWGKLSGAYSRSLVASAVGGGVLLVYLLTLAPTVASNDAGRFQIAAPLLGTVHPTGYPTFILLGKLFTYLPFGDVAYRVSLMSALSGAAAAALLFLVAREVGGRDLPAAGGALLLAFSATFWSQATVAEVYTMHAAFLLGVALLMLRWRQTGRTVELLAAALLYGLSLGNNAGMVLLAPAFLVLLVSGRRWLSLWRLLSAAGCSLLGLSVYLYVPIRGFAGAWHNYGDPVEDWEDVWEIISAARFQGEMGVSPPELAENAGGFLWQLSQQALHPPGYAIGLLLLAGGAYGGWTALRRDRAVGLALILGLLCTLGYAVNYQIPDIWVYYIPVYVFLALLLAVGVSTLSERARSPALLASVPLLAAALALGVNYEPLDRSGYYAEREQAETVMEHLPEDAVLYGKADIIPIAYLQEVEGRREGVTLRWLTTKTLDEHMIQDLQSGRPVYLVSDPDYNEDYLSITDNYSEARKEGGLIRLVPEE